MKILCKKRKNEWWEIVDNATWQLNCKMLLESCKNRGKVRTKTLKISDFIENGQYEYKRPQNPLFELPRKVVRTIIMARYGMLECANNYSGKYGTKLCKDCKVIDDESHRLNTCKRWSNVNLYGRGCSINFESVFSDDKETLLQLSTCLKSVWNLEHGKNEMQC